MVFLFSRIHSDIINTQLRDFSFPLECVFQGWRECGLTRLRASESLASPWNRGLSPGAWGTLDLGCSTHSGALGCPSRGDADAWCSHCQQLSLTPFQASYHNKGMKSHKHGTWTCTNRHVPSLSQQNTRMCGFL